MTNEKDREEARKKAWEFAQKVHKGFTFSTPRHPVDIVIEHDDAVRTEAVQAGRERWSALIEKAIHEFEVKDPMPDAPHFSIHGIAVTLRKKQVEMLRAILTADPEPCEDAVDACDKILIGVQDELGIEISEESWARLSDLVISPLLATQVADKRAEEMRAYRRLFVQALDALYEAIEIAPTDMIPGKAAIALQEIQSIIGDDAVKEIREALAATDPKQ